MLLITLAKVKSIHNNKLACCMCETKMHNTSHVHTFMCLCRYIFCTFHNREWISTCGGNILLLVMVPRIVNPFTWINLQLLQPNFLSLLLYKLMSSSHLIQQAFMVAWYYRAPKLVWTFWGNSRGQVLYYQKYFCIFVKEYVMSCEFLFLWLPRCVSHSQNVASLCYSISLYLYRGNLVFINCFHW